MTTLFISDLHLDAERPAITALFLDFLQREAHRADALFILGDLFEAWVGDDEGSALSNEVAGALMQVRTAGVPIGFIRGNRDFLLGHDYAQRSGMTLLPDPCVLELQGQPTLLLHGDVLCTDDVDYLAFRNQVRQLTWQQDFLAQPLPQRQAFARKARGESRAHQQGRAQEIGDASTDAVNAMLRRYGITRMIHGHTHRPAVHDIAHDDDVARQRIVLGDWYEQGSVLRLDRKGQYRLDALSA